MVQKTLRSVIPVVLLPTFVISYLNASVNSTNNLAASQETVLTSIQYIYQTASFECSISELIQLSPTIIQSDKVATNYITDHTNSHYSQYGFHCAQHGGFEPMKSVIHT